MAGVGMMMEEKSGESHPPPPATPSVGSVAGKKQFSAFKLIVDPVLVKATFKSYRYDGRCPDDPMYPNISVRDPRNKIRPQRIEELELPVPLFLIDDNYVGKPPSIQVTVTNLNDNIDRNFFKNILAKHWSEGYEEFQLFYHPVTNKHLGVAHVTFKRPSFAKSFVEKLHDTSIMGQKINAFMDPHVTKCKKLVQELTVVKPIENDTEGDVTEGKPPKPTSAGSKKDQDTKKQQSRKGSALTSGNTTEPSTNGRFGAHEPFVSALQLEGSYPGYAYLFQPPLPDAASNSPTPWTSNNQEDNDDFFSPKVDLDTRIRQVFSGKLNISQLTVLNCVYLLENTRFDSFFKYRESINSSWAENTFFR